LLQKALLKDAAHERIIFIEVNLPYDCQPPFQQGWHLEVLATLNSLEQQQRPHDPWPQAIVFFTNRKIAPWPAQSDAGSATVLLTAINHPLFKIEDCGPAEREYPEVGALFRAANELAAPPSHFPGQ
jgi:hypothetical protein